MSEVEQLAQEQFNTFKNRLCEILSEIEEEHKSAFMYGYAQGETDEKLRTKQVVTKENAELKKELKEEKDYNTTLRKEIDEYTNSHTLCVKYKELQQENAELKSGCGMCYRKDKEKLVEARELLKRWLRLYNTNTVKGIIADTEQFIKE